MFFIGLVIGFTVGWLAFKRPDKITEWVERLKVKLGS